MRTPIVAALLVLATACRANPDAATVQADTAAATSPATSFPERADEPHLRNLRMLTNGGENAEAYWSADGRQLIFQATRPGVSSCDQIFTMNADGSDVRMVSTGRGRTTCAYFFPAGDRILYSSTHHVGTECPPPPDYSMGYVWALYEYDVFAADPDGGNPRQLTTTPGYDAEATTSPDGRTIVFTSVRDGDLDIYTMAADGSNVRRLTSTPGYDGGPFFSRDGRSIVYRAHHPGDSTDLADYRRLLDAGLVRPTTLDIWVMDADGSNQRRVTTSAAANFAPFFHPDGRRIIFSSNIHEPDGRNFDLYLVNLDGSGLERVTTHPDFDGFPMFSPDGRQLVFASNRGAAQPGETNVFLADWVD
jgi:Tol biopolymer transport system component